MYRLISTRNIEFFQGIVITEIFKPNSLKLCLLFLIIRKKCIRSREIYIVGFYFRF